MIFFLANMNPNNRSRLRILLSIECFPNVLNELNVIKQFCPVRKPLALEKGSAATFDNLDIWRCYHNLRANFNIISLFYLGNLKSAHYSKESLNILKVFIQNSNIALQSSDRATNMIYYLRKVYLETEITYSNYGYWHGKLAYIFNVIICILQFLLRSLTTQKSNMIRFSLFVTSL